MSEQPYSEEQVMVEAVVRYLEQSQGVLENTLSGLVAARNEPLPVHVAEAIGHLVGGLEVYVNAMRMTVAELHRFEPDE